MREKTSSRSLFWPTREREKSRGPLEAQRRKKAWLQEWHPAMDSRRKRRREMLKICTLTSSKVET